MDTLVSIAANVICVIALILVGGFGTRLRPLVCSPPPPDLTPRQMDVSQTSAILTMLVILDFDAPEAAGRIWKSPNDFAPSRELGCCGCYGYRVGRQLPSGCDGVDPEEGAF